MLADLCVAKLADLAGLQNHIAILLIVLDVVFFWFQRYMTLQGPESNRRKI